MTNRLHWIQTTGGPHLLAPVERLSDWHGVEGWRENSPDDFSDYARACRIEGWLGTVRAGDGEVVVLGGDVSNVAWIPEDDAGGVLVRWIACDSEETILALLSGRKQNRRADLVPKFDTESERFETGPSGEMTLLDAADNGHRGIGERYTFRLRPGRYGITASFVESGNCTLLLMDVRLTSR